MATVLMFAGRQLLLSFFLELLLCLFTPDCTNRIVFDGGYKHG